MDDAARKLGFKDGKARSAVDRLQALEEGVDKPSRAVLLQMSKQYRRPLLTFYLAAPPGRGDRGEDFRTLPDAPDPAEDALVDALIRDIRARQQMVRSAIEDDEVVPLGFVGSLSMQHGVSAVAAAIAKEIGFDVRAFRNERNPEAAFASLRSAVERLGVFALLIGNLGSHHSTLEPEIFRGFALADPVAPFIVINDHDAKAAWSFTLLHEVAHIWLGATGVSGGKPLGGIERFCNEVASEILLPEGEFIPDEWRLAANNFENLVDAILAFARPRNVSFSLVAFRLFRAGVISEQQWERCRQHFRSIWQRQRASAREIARANNASGPSYYVVRRHKLGEALVTFVRHQMDDGDLSPSKAAKILGVKARSVSTLVDNGRELSHRAAG